jgi:hypothetical protein
MNFHDLRIIVSQIKRTMKCPDCKTRYTDEDIEIIGSLGDEQVFFHAWCIHCETQSVINVQIDPSWFNCPEPHLGNAPRMGHVSSNEVLDMHNFLKEFNGDFTQLFDKEPRKS